MQYPQTPRELKLNIKVTEADIEYMRALWDRGQSLTAIGRAVGESHDSKPLCHHTVQRYVDYPAWQQYRLTYVKGEVPAKKQKEYAKRARERKRKLFGSELTKYHTAYYRQYRAKKKLST
jgi:hypothetical protein